MLNLLMADIHFSLTPVAAEAPEVKLKYWENVTFHYLLSIRVSDIFLLYFLLRDQRQLPIKVS